MLHASCGFRNFTCKREFRAEVRRLFLWYKSARKVERPTAQRRRRVLRSAQGHALLPRARSAIAAKVRLHYRRLCNKTRIAGLWNWRKVALLLHEGGLPIQSGTVPVERLWSHATFRGSTLVHLLIRPCLFEDQLHHLPLAFLAPLGTDRRSVGRESGEHVSRCSAAHAGIC